MDPKNNEHLPNLDDDSYLDTLLEGNEKPAVKDDEIGNVLLGIYDNSVYKGSDQGNESTSNSLDTSFQNKPLLKNNLLRKNENNKMLNDKKKNGGNFVDSLLFKMTQKCNVGALIRKINDIPDPEIPNNKIHSELSLDVSILTLGNTPEVKQDKKDSEIPIISKQEILKEDNSNECAVSDNTHLNHVNDVKNQDIPPQNHATESKKPILINKMPISGITVTPINNTNEIKDKNVTDTSKSVQKINDKTLVNNENKIVDTINKNIVILKLSEKDNNMIISNLKYAVKNYNTIISEKGMFSFDQVGDKSINFVFNLLTMFNNSESEIFYASDVEICNGQKVPNQIFDFTKLLSVLNRKNTIKIPNGLNICPVKSKIVKELDYKPDITITKLPQNCVETSFNDNDFDDDEIIPLENCTTVYDDVPDEIIVKKPRNTNLDNIGRIPIDLSVKKPSVKNQNNKMTNGEVEIGPSYIYILENMYSNPSSSEDFVTLKSVNQLPRNLIQNNVLVKMNGKDAQNYKSNSGKIKIASQELSAEVQDQIKRCMDETINTVELHNIKNTEISDTPECLNLIKRPENPNEIIIHTVGQGWQEKPIVSIIPITKEHQNLDKTRQNKMTNIEETITDVENIKPIEKECLKNSICQNKIDEIVDQVVDTVETHKQLIESEQPTICNVPPPVDKEASILEIVSSDNIKERVLNQDPVCAEVIGSILNTIEIHNQLIDKSTIVTQEIIAISDDEENLNSGNLRKNVEILKTVAQTTNQFMENEQPTISKVSPIIKEIVISDLNSGDLHKTIEIIETHEETSPPTEQLIENELQTINNIPIIEEIAIFDNEVIISSENLHKTVEIIETSEETVSPPTNQSIENEQPTISNVSHVIEEIIYDDEILNSEDLHKNIENIRIREENVTATTNQVIENQPMISSISPIIEEIIISDDEYINSEDVHKNVEIITTGEENVSLPTNQLIENEQPTISNDSPIIEDAVVSDSEVLNSGGLHKNVEFSVSSPTNQLIENEQPSNSISHVIEESDDEALNSEDLRKTVKIVETREETVPPPTEESIQNEQPTNSISHVIEDSDDEALNSEDLRKTVKIVDTHEETVPPPTDQSIDYEQPTISNASHIIEDIVISDDEALNSEDLDRNVKIVETHEETISSPINQSIENERPTIGNDSPMIEDTVVFDDKIVNAGDSHKNVEISVSLPTNQLIENEQSTINNLAHIIEDIVISDDKILNSEDCHKNVKIIETNEETASPPTNQLIENVQPMISNISPIEEIVISDDENINSEILEEIVSTDNYIRKPILNQRSDTFQNLVCEEVIDAIVDKVENCLVIEDSLSNPSLCEEVIIETTDEISPLKTSSMLGLISDQNLDKRLQNAEILLNDASVGPVLVNGCARIEKETIEIINEVEVCSEAEHKNATNNLLCENCISTNNKNYFINKLPTIFNEVCINEKIEECTKNDVSAFKIYPSPPDKPAETVVQPLKQIEECSKNCMFKIHTFPDKPPETIVPLTHIDECKNTVSTFKVHPITFPPERSAETVRSPPPLSLKKMFSKSMSNQIDDAQRLTYMNPVPSTSADFNMSSSCGKSVSIIYSKKLKRCIPLDAHDPDDKKTVENTSKATGEKPKPKKSVLKKKTVYPDAPSTRIMKLRNSIKLMEEPVVQSNPEDIYDDVPLSERIKNFRVNKNDKKSTKKIIKPIDSVKMTRQRKQLLDAKEKLRRVRKKLDFDQVSEDVKSQPKIRLKLILNTKSDIVNPKIKNSNQASSSTTGKKTISKATNDILNLDNSIQASSSTTRKKTISKATNDILNLDNSTQASSSTTRKKTISKATNDILNLDNSIQASSSTTRKKTISKATNDVLNLDNSIQPLSTTTRKKTISKATNDVLNLDNSIQPLSSTTRKKTISKAKNDVLNLDNSNRSLSLTTRKKTVSKAINDVLNVDNSNQSLSSTTGKKTISKAKNDVLNLDNSIQPLSLTPGKNTISKAKNDVLNLDNSIQPLSLTSGKKTISKAKNDVLNLDNSIQPLSLTTGKKIISKTKNNGLNLDNSIELLSSTMGEESVSKAKTDVLNIDIKNGMKMNKKSPKPKQNIITDIILIADQKISPKNNMKTRRKQPNLIKNKIVPITPVVKLVQNLNKGKSPKAQNLKKVLKSKNSDIDTKVENSIISKLRNYNKLQKSDDFLVNGENTTTFLNQRNKKKETLKKIQSNKSPKISKKSLISKNKLLIPVSECAENEDILNTSTCSKSVDIFNISTEESVIDEKFDSFSPANEVESVKQDDTPKIVNEKTINHDPIIVLSDSSDEDKSKVVYDGIHSQKRCSKFSDSSEYEDREESPPKKKRFMNRVPITYENSDTANNNNSNADTPKPTGSKRRKNPKKPIRKSTSNSTPDLIGENDEKFIEFDNTSFKFNEENQSIEDDSKTLAQTVFESQDEIEIKSAHLNANAEDKSSLNNEINTDECKERNAEEILEISTEQLSYSEQDGTDEKETVQIQDLNVPIEMLDIPQNEIFVESIETSLENVSEIVEDLEQSPIETADVTLNYSHETIEDFKESPFKHTETTDISVDSHESMEESPSKFVKTADISFTDCPELVKEVPSKSTDFDISSNHSYEVVEDLKEQPSKPIDEVIEDLEEPPLNSTQIIEIPVNEGTEDFEELHSKPKESDTSLNESHEAIDDLKELPSKPAEVSDIIIDEPIEEQEDSPPKPSEVSSIILDGAIENMEESPYKPIEVSNIIIEDIEEYSKTAETPQNNDIYETIDVEASTETSNTPLNNYSDELIENLTQLPSTETEDTSQNYYDLEELPSKPTERDILLNNNEGTEEQPIETVVILHNGREVENVEEPSMEIKVIDENAVILHQEVQDTMESLLDSVDIETMRTSIKNIDEPTNHLDYENKIKDGFALKCLIEVLDCVEKSKQESTIVTEESSPKIINTDFGQDRKFISNENQNVSIIQVDEKKNSDFHNPFVELFEICTMKNISKNVSSPVHEQSIFNYSSSEIIDNNTKSSVEDHIPCETNDKKEDTKGPEEENTPCPPIDKTTENVIQLTPSQDPTLVENPDLNETEIQIANQDMDIEQSEIENTQSILEPVEQINSYELKEIYLQEIKDNPSTPNEEEIYLQHIKVSSPSTSNKPKEIDLHQIIDSSPSTSNRTDEMDPQHFEDSSPSTSNKQEEIYLHQIEDPSPSTSNKPDKIDSQHIKDPIPSTSNIQEEIYLQQIEDPSPSTSNKPKEMDLHQIIYSSPSTSSKTDEMDSQHIKDSSPSTSNKQEETYLHQMEDPSPCTSNRTDEMDSQHIKDSSPSTSNKQEETYLHQIEDPSTCTSNRTDEMDSQHIKDSSLPTSNKQEETYLHQIEDPSTCTSNRTDEMDSQHTKDSSLSTSNKQEETYLHQIEDPSPSTSNRTDEMDLQHIKDPSPSTSNKQEEIYLHQIEDPSPSTSNKPDEINTQHIKDLIPSTSNKQEEIYLQQIEDPSPSMSNKPEEIDSQRIIDPSPSTSKTLPEGLGLASIKKACDQYISILKRNNKSKIDSQKMYNQLSSVIEVRLIGLTELEISKALDVSRPVRRRPGRKRKNLQTTPKVVLKEHNRNLRKRPDLREKRPGLREKRPGLREKRPDLKETPSFENTSSRIRLQRVPPSTSPPPQPIIIKLNNLKAQNNPNACKIGEPRELPPIDVMAEKLKNYLERNGIKNKDEVTKNFIQLNEPKQTIQTDPTSPSNCTNADPQNNQIVPYEGNLNPYDAVAALFPHTRWFLNTYVNQTPMPNPYSYGYYPPQMYGQFYGYPQYNQDFQSNQSFQNNHNFHQERHKYPSTSGESTSNIEEMNNEESENEETSSIKIVHVESIAHLTDIDFSEPSTFEESNENIIIQNTEENNRKRKNKDNDDSPVQRKRPA